MVESGDTPLAHGMAWGELVLLSRVGPRHDPTEHPTCNTSRHCVAAAASFVTNGECPSNFAVNGDRLMMNDVSTKLVTRNLTNVTLFTILTPDNLNVHQTVMCGEW